MKPCAPAFILALSLWPWVGSPADNGDLDTFRLHPDFEIELVASEPLVRDPVAFDWSADGDLWVVEMADYPLGMDNHGKPGGRVRILDDTDRDGRYDRARVFLDDLLFPTSVMAWRAGALVACAPDLFYAEDTSGDGRADRREVLFTGFGEANPQHRVNALRWGLDNWIHCANGDFSPERQRVPSEERTAASTLGFSPSQAEDLRRLELASARILSLRTGHSVDMRNRDLRFRPDDGRLEAQSGQSQFGRDRDDWGNWFACNHSTPLWHYALRDEYLRRNPHVAPPSGRVTVSRAVTYAAPATGRATGTRRNVSGNPFTSACSVTVYRDTLFGPDFSGSWFVCEPVHNLVHREILVPHGATFRSRRAAGEETTEFLSSTDAMFSPVAVRTGPDGALWIADMRRAVLEHPHWLPDGWEERVDVRAGHEEGRIYRVFPRRRPPRSTPRFSQLTTHALLSRLESPSGWQRDLAQRLLIERGDPEAIEPLKDLSRSSSHPLGRLQALCTLDGLDGTTPQVLQAALSDRHPGVRRHAVRLSEPHLTSSPPLGPLVAQLADDHDPQVRLQVAYTLGAWKDPRAGAALGGLLTRNGQDVLMTAAVISSANADSLPALVDATLKRPEVGAPTELAPCLGDLLTSATGFGQADALQKLLRALATTNLADTATKPQSRLDRLTLVADWLDALDQRSTTLLSVFKEADGPLQQSLSGLGAIFRQARQEVRDLRASPNARIVASRLLGRGLDQHKEDRETLAKLLQPQVDGSLQRAAVSGLARLHDPEVATALLATWPTYSPALREHVIDALVQRTVWIKELLARLEAGEVAVTEMDAAHRQQLRDYPVAEIRERAAALVSERVEGERTQVVVAYREALARTGDTTRGQHVFTKTCASCHRLGDIGRPVGPNLAAARDKPPEWFLSALFDPNRAVDAKYVSYTVVTRDGRALSGFVRNQNAQSVTIVGSTGEVHVVLRSNLAGFSSTGKSAMPEGLEEGLSIEDVADLIAFLRRGPS